MKLIETTSLLTLCYVESVDIQTSTESLAAKLRELEATFCEHAVQTKMPKACSFLTYTLTSRTIFLVYIIFRCVFVSLKKTTKKQTSLPNGSTVE